MENFDRDHPHPLFAQLKLLVGMGFISAVSEDADGGMHYEIDSEKSSMLLPILARPQTWDESPRLAQCKVALQHLRDQACEEGYI